MHLQTQNSFKIACASSRMRFLPAQVALAYLALSGLAGLAVTYYYDSEANTKMHTILKVGLKLAGLGLVATSTSMPQVNAGCPTRALPVAAPGHPAQAALAFSQSGSFWSHADVL